MAPTARVTSRRVIPAAGGMHSAEGPGATHAALREEALALTGGPNARARCATILYEVYRDSRGNHRSPLIALHMVLWGEAFFAVNGHLGTVLQYRYCYDEHERARRLAMLHRFAETLDGINRQLCAHIYADYHGTKRLSAEPEAYEAVPAGLYRALTGVHERTRSGEQLDPQSAKEVFLASWRHQQDLIAAPLRAAVERLDCPILRAMIIQPMMRLAYFPAHSRIVYRDFADRTERTARGAQAYDLGSDCGWEAVAATMHAYGVLPPSFLRSLDTPITAE